MNIKQLKEIWKEHGFAPGKSLGQNFLIDSNIRNKILRSLELDRENSVVVEIGMGFGSMSFELAERCRRLYAVEKDKRVYNIMAPLVSDKAENIELVNSDILDIDISEICNGNDRVILYGNIPYNISTPILEQAIKYRKHIDKVYLVVQDEFASRIVAPPGSRTYGSISCFIQYYSNAEKLFRISRKSFFPVPKVESALLKLDILNEPSVNVKDEDLMFRIIRKSFSQRRKKMINPLSDGTFPGLNREKWKDLFTGCGIDISVRAEQLSLRDFASLSDQAGDNIIT